VLAVAPKPGRGAAPADPPSIGGVEIGESEDEVGLRSEERSCNADGRQGTNRQHENGQSRDQ
jgi:hypothetical protein